ncbi:hypothetical protein ACJIZ3_003919 [Penstemon smallii]|uniref:Uncharacterized protein n=1 Tax=Penstemon smallii TaxID=265156 RepID=A0ABD3S0K1_9LAMI
MFFMKSTSRTVHNYREDQEKEKKNCSEETAESTCLTVWRKSLIFNCNGFTVIGSDGNLFYRVDNYTARPDQIILMDGSGNSIFTICRSKKLKLLRNYWLVYEGEVDNKYCKNSTETQPIFCVRKKLNFMQTKLNVLLAHVYIGTLSDHKRCTYMVEGSYVHRSCKILDESGRVVAEIKKKEAIAEGVSFGLEYMNYELENSGMS